MRLAASRGVSEEARVSPLALRFGSCGEMDGESWRVGWVWAKIKLERIYFTGGKQNSSDLVVIHANIFNYGKTYF